jgi:hypothetical protein
MNLALTLKPEQYKMKLHESSIEKNSWKKSILLFRSGRFDLCPSHDACFHLIDPCDKVRSMLLLSLVSLSLSLRQSLKEFKILIEDSLAAITATNTSPSLFSLKRSEAILVSSLSLSGSLPLISLPLSVSLPLFAPLLLSVGTDNSYVVTATVLKNRFTILSITGSSSS